MSANLFLAHQILFDGLLESNMTILMGLTCLNPEMFWLRSCSKTRPCELAALTLALSVRTLPSCLTKRLNNSQTY